MNNKKIIKASLFHSPKYGEIEFLKQALIFITDNGIISKIVKQEDENYQIILEKVLHESNYTDFEDKNSFAWIY